MSLPPDAECSRSPSVRVAGLVARLGRDEVVAACCALLGGAPREDHLGVLPALSGHTWQRGDAVRDPARWKDYWLRTWGARGLLHAWDDAATAAVLAGLDDAHWRPVEMCLKICATHEVAGAGDPVAALVAHPERRVRAQVARALAVVGDVEHVPVLRALVVDDDDGVRAAARRALVHAARRLDLPGGAS